MIAKEAFKSLKALVLLKYFWCEVFNTFLLRKKTFFNDIKDIMGFLLV